MAEISYRDGSLIPDLSFGTHFFHDLIETRIFYMAIYPEHAEVVFNQKWFMAGFKKIPEYFTVNNTHSFIQGI